MQPVGHLCDLLGISRQRPGVFHAMVDLLYGEGEGSGAPTVDARIDELAARMARRSH
jgi:hypothetical protein